MADRRFFQRRKVCRFCTDMAPAVDYKDTLLLRTYLTDRGKIIPRRISGTCTKHQRQLTLSIKRSRNIALMPFAEAR